MSLIPYPITVVRSDDDGSGKNIVPFASVSILDSVGSVAALKSDSGGTVLANPFTLDANGQKQIWVEPGIYQISIAGGPYLQTFISSATTEDFTSGEKTKLSRAIFAVDGITEALPNAAGRASKYLKFDLEGDPIVKTNAEVFAESAVEAGTNPGAANTIVLAGVTHNPGSVRTALNVENGAQANVATNLAVGGSGDSRTITSSTGDDANLPISSASNAGLMSTARTSKLDSLPDNSALNTLLDARELLANKRTSLVSPDNTGYPTTLTVASAIAAVSSGSTPKGAWNASTNVPALASGVGTAGWFYEVSVAGTTDLNGEDDWQIGDKAIFNGSSWSRIPASAVVSINGKQGTVVNEFDAVADLAAVNASAGDRVVTKGCVSVEGGGHGTFIASATPVGAVNGYSCIESATAGVYFNLQPVGGVLFARQFGVVADGATDNNAALQRLATAAKELRCAVQLGEGVIRSVGGEIEWQHPVTVTGMGSGRTSIVYESMGGYAGENGFDLTIDSGRYETSVFANFTVQVKGANGAYGISTAMGGAVFGYRPKIVCHNLVFKGFVESGTIGLFDYTWQRCLSIGDGVGHEISNVEVFGNYDYTLDPAGQNVTATAFYLSCIENEGGMTMPKIDHCFTQFCGTPVHLGFRVSNATISFSQFHRSYWGIYSPNPFLGANYGNDETYLYGLNINSQRSCVYSAGGGFFSMHGVRATRSAGGFDHAEGWTAFDMNDMIDLKMYDTRAYNAGTYSNPMIGYKFSNVERITGSGFFHRGALDIGIQIDEPEYVAIHGLQYENGTTDVGVELNRTVVTNSNVNISGYLDAGLVTTRYAFTGTASRSILNEHDRLTTVVTSVTAFTTAGTTTLVTGVDDDVQRFACNSGAGPYTRNFAFSNTGAKKGDFFELNVSQVATNPTVTFTDGAGTLLDTITPTGATQKHYVKLRHNGSQWRIIDSSVSRI